MMEKASHDMIRDIPHFLDEGNDLSVDHVKKYLGIGKLSNDPCIRREAVEPRTHSSNAS